MVNLLIPLSKHAKVVAEDKVCKNIRKRDEIDRYDDVEHVEPIITSRRNVFSTIKTNY